jgi:hypothetical protein
MIIKKEKLIENHELFQLKINNEIIFVKKYPLPELKYSIHESFNNGEKDGEGNIIYYPESHELNSTHNSNDAEVIDNLYDEINDLSIYEIIEDLIK